MAEDAKAIARRIVQDVLATHEQAQAAAAADGEGAEGPPPLPASAMALDQPADAATPDRVADAVDDSPARQLARRIVAEVLEAHATAQQDVAAAQPAVAEGEAPGVPAASPTLQPAEGSAVLPGAPEPVVADPSAEVTADEASAIARRIVASVLAEAGPPPIPQATEPDSATSSPAPVFDEPVPDGPVAEEPVAEEPIADEPVTDEPAAEEPVTAVPATDEPLFTAQESATVDEAPVSEPDGATPADGSALDETDPEEPVAEEPVADEPDVDEVALDDALFVDHALDDERTDDVGEQVSPDSTAVLPADDDADPDRTTRVPVATLERDDAGADPTRSVPVVDEPTVAIPADKPRRRTGRWLLVTVLGIGALFVLLPMAIEALRSLVALS